MRCLYFSDTHLRSTTPACRLDQDFYTVQFDKLKQIMAIIESMRIDYVFHGGDLFDVHNPPLKLVHDVSSLLRQSKATWLINPGNHDIFGETTETLDRSGLGVINLFETVRVYAEPTDVDLGDILVRFIPRTKDVDMSRFIFSSMQLSKTYIVIPHMMLTPRPMIYPHLEIKDLKTNADLVLCSDYHGQFKERHGNTTFINPGPLTRQSVTEKNICPSVAYIDTEAHKAEILQLKFAPAEKVMLLDQEAGVEKSMASDFLEVLKASTFENRNRHDLVREVGARVNAASSVVDATVLRVKESETLMGL